MIKWLLVIVALPVMERTQLGLSLPVLIALLAVVTSGIAVMICTFVVHRRCLRHKLPVRDRIVSMHTNALYLQDSAAVFDKDMKSSQIYNVSHRPATAPLLMPPNIRQMSISEYEIPLDKKWEFPRSRYVKGTSVCTL